MLRLIFMFAFSNIYDLWSLVLIEQFILNSWGKTFIYFTKICNFFQICQGGKIPKSYYIKNQERQTTDGSNKYTQVTIKKGDKLSIDLLAVQDGSFLKYAQTFLYSHSKKTS